MNDRERDLTKPELTALPRARGGVRTGVRAGAGKTTEKIFKQMSDYIHS